MALEILCQLFTPEAVWQLGRLPYQSKI